MAKLYLRRNAGSVILFIRFACKIQNFCQLMFQSGIGARKFLHQAICRCNVHTHINSGRSHTPSTAAHQKFISEKNTLLAVCRKFYRMFTCSTCRFRVRRRPGSADSNDGPTRYTWPPIASSRRRAGNIGTRCRIDR